MGYRDQESSKIMAAETERRRGGASSPQDVRELPGPGLFKEEASTNPGSGHANSLGKKIELMLPSASSVDDMSVYHDLLNSCSLSGRSGTRHRRSRCCRLAEDESETSSLCLHTRWIMQSRHARSFWRRSGCLATLHTPYRMNASYIAVRLLD